MSIGLLNTDSKLSENSIGSMYECIFPDFIVRFTIYKDSSRRVECYFWDNDGSGKKKGQGRCLRAFLKSLPKEVRFKDLFLPRSKFGKGFDSFEEANQAWTDFYNKYRSEK